MFHRFLNKFQALLRQFNFQTQALTVLRELFDKPLNIGGGSVEP